VKKLSNEYQRLREKNQEKQLETVSLEEAKANRLKLF
jgi:5-methyltetrahydrofolate--homocysteine methyltransferase